MRANLDLARRSAYPSIFGQVLGYDDLEIRDGNTAAKHERYSTPSAAEVSIGD